MTPTSPGTREEVQLVVLVVDDSARNRKLACDVLRAAGLQTLAAATGGEAVALAAAYLPDVILMDLRLPDMDGADAARVLADSPRTGRIPVLAMSSLPRVDDWFLAVGSPTTSRSRSTCGTSPSGCAAPRGQRVADAREIQLGEPAPRRASTASRHRRAGLARRPRASYRSPHARIAEGSSLRRDARLGRPARRLARRVHGLGAQRVGREGDQARRTDARRHRPHPFVVAGAQGASRGARLGRRQERRADVAKPAAGGSRRPGQGVRAPARRRDRRVRGQVDRRRAEGDGGAEGPDPGRLPPSVRPGQGRPRREPVASGDEPDGGLRRAGRRRQAARDLRAPRSRAPSRAHSRRPERQDHGPAPEGVQGRGRGAGAPRPARHPSGLDTRRPQAHLPIPAPGRGRRSLPAVAEPPAQRLRADDRARPARGDPGPGAPQGVGEARSALLVRDRSRRSSGAPARATSTPSSAARRPRISPSRRSRRSSSRSTSRPPRGSASRCRRR